MLIFKEPISSCDLYMHLTLVPWELYNNIFIAFHVNPISGHLNAYRTLHRLCLRYYWPGMYAYVKRMCHACPGCMLSTQLMASLQNLYITSQLRRRFWSFTSMLTLLASTPALRGQGFTSLTAGACAALPAWNLSPICLPLLLHQQS